MILVREKPACFGTICFFRRAAYLVVKSIPTPMKKFVLLLFLFSAAETQAQLKVANGTLTIGAYTMLTVDELTLISTWPSSITNTVITKSNVPVALNNTVFSINRVWTFSNPVEFSGTVRFLYKSDGLNGHTESALKLSYRGANVWRPSSGGIVFSTMDCIDETLEAKTFDGLTASAPYAVLPVSLQSFTARLRPEGGVLLQWQTASERSNRSFTVERSGDGRLVEVIGILPAAGSSGAVYRLVDPQPLRGINYYQLRQHDINGNEQLLGLRVVKTGAKAGTASLSPNPVMGGEVRISLGIAPAKPLAYSITAANGQLFRTGGLTAQHQIITITDLPAGLYLLQLGDGQTLRFQKF